MKKITKNSYKEFVEKYEAFPWEINSTDNRDWVRGKHSFVLSYIRFWQVLNKLKSIIPATHSWSVVDVGAYPGSMLKLLREFFGSRVNYLGVGLGFPIGFKEEMQKLGGDIFETELDPAFIAAKTSEEWPSNSLDCCLFLDVIEHLTNPINCLDKINKALKFGGDLIITTDNITSFGNSYLGFTKGVSPNIHPVRSSIFYQGDWRPHFQEFSKNELLFYLDYCGFELVEHEYFERKQGDFYLDNNLSPQLYEISRYKGIKGFVRKMIVKFVPHLRDHQLLHARKVEDFESNLQSRPKATTNLEEWLQIRKTYGID